MSIMKLKIMVLGAEVDEELRNPDLINRTHGTRSCYNRGGCRGPLCAYVMRRERRTEGTVTTAPREFDEYLEDRLVKHHAEHAERLALQRRSKPNV